MKGERWTEEEKEILRNKYSNTPTKKLAKEIDRTKKAISRKANSMNLKKSKKQLSESNKRNPEIEITTPKNKLMYIAGLFDGEGWVGTYERKGENRWRNIRLHTQISNSNKDVLNWVSSKIGFGNINKSSETENCVVYEYRLSGYQAEKFLDAIKKFLIIKKSSVEEALKKWRNQ